MKRLLAVKIIFLLQLLPSLVWAGNLEKFIEGVENPRLALSQATKHNFKNVFRLESQRDINERLLELANDGNVLAQMFLAGMFMKSTRIPNRDKLAAKWFYLAAKQGVVVAQSTMGDLFRMGKGVPEDKQKAFYWTNLAANQGDVPAQSNLGIMYRNGYFVKKDNVAAVKWFRRAAENGFASAQTNLGVSYAKGFGGLTTNYIKAHMWFTLSLSLQGRKAKKLLQSIERRMTPPQIALARELALQCQKNNYKGC